jgi:hypothetical protein
MFASYEEININNDQTNRITDWLSNWDLGDSTIGQDTTRSPLPAQRTRLDSFESETSDPWLSSDQTNISNWLTSWGHSTHSKTRHNTMMMTVLTQESTTNRYSDLE